MERHGHNNICKGVVNAASARVQSQYDDGRITMISDELGFQVDNNWDLLEK